MTINIGIIGAGRIGRLHAANLVHRIPEARVAAIADIVPEAALAAAEQLGIPQATADYREILSNPEIDAVAICSATDTHARIIIEAAQAGKHIFCEKPIDHDLARIDQALEAVKQAGVKLQIGFNRRFDANFRAVREAITAGKIGEPHVIRITSRDPAPPPVDYIRVSGGIFLDMTIHDFDMIRFLMDNPVVEVYATGSVLIDPAIGEAGDVDTAVTTLKFESGAIGIIENSRKAVYGYDQRVEVFGSKGAIAAENNTPYRATLSDETGVHGPTPLYFFLERYNDAYVTELSDFIRAVEEDKPTPVTGEDGRAPVVIGLAALKSLRENRPVKLDEI
ncbi:MAG: inositol 2-dehydrogenase [Chloroflexota bacterium]